MNRRTLLAALSAGLAGIAGCEGADSGRPTRSTYGVPETTGSEPTGERRWLPEESDRPASLRRAVRTDFGRTRRLVLAGEPATTTLEGTLFEVGFTAAPSPSRPGRIWMAVTNATEEAQTFGVGPTPPFSNYWATREHRHSRTLLLVPTDREEFPYGDLVPDEPTGGRWVASDVLGTPQGDVGERELTLEADETVAGEYALLYHPDHTRVPERAVYRFDADWTPGSLGMAVWTPSMARPAGSRFGVDAPSPEFPDADWTRWYHGAGDRDARIYLAPERERLELPTDATSLVLWNFSYRFATLDVPGVFKQYRGDWKRIAPWRDTVGERDAVSRAQSEVLPPGGRAGTRFAVDNTTGGADLSAGLSGLGPGLYAVRWGTAPTERLPADEPVTVRRFDRVRTTPDRRPSVGFAALLELRGDPLVLDPTSGVERVRREGDTVVVDVEPEFGLAGEEGRLVVRTERPPPDRATVLITEQVTQFPALRNALSQFEDGVDRVVVRTTAGRVRRPLERLGTGSRLNFVHEDTGYEARTGTEEADG